MNKRFYCDSETEAETSEDYEPFNDPDNWDEIDENIEQHE